ncbi:mannan endo-1,4-beta-mannosidase [Breznakibacter xylanolyticus]|uniref:Mannan endo-1,4-beta-mannosidase n=1 Tax=Breznakibacter xylanolyticus TaxID=990 RepID=A0A2W7NB09_9BACT|nr:glycosyl hydrolase [Breznakibacter xylanolyticus]PZX16833.1 mannan endo-1,4-beta-mannosidase [Breznakibacter xylanolyticus]
MRRFVNLLFSILILTLGFCEITACSSSDEDEPGIKPQLVSSTPANGATNVAVSTTTIELTYNCKVKWSSAASFRLNDKPVNPLNLSLDGEKITIKNISLEQGMIYELIVSQEAVMSYDGNVPADEHRISFSTVPKPDQVISTSLVTPSPSPEAVNVYNFLLENYRKNIISATMANVSWNINEAEWVKQHTGKFPAMVTFDYGHLPASPANWIDYSQTAVVENWWGQKGLISAGWHWIVPRYEGHADINKFTYKPEETTFRAVNALKDGTWENKILKADLEKMAGYLFLLKNKNIPVIWRPLHEAAGNIYEYNNGTAWFWWGYDGAETYVQLWRYMFDYFKAQGLNNLIWVWTTQTKDNAFYPGDAYVDIVGRDIYNNSTLTNLAAQFTSIQDAYPTKMVTLSECGNVAKMSAQWAAGAEWSFFMPWYDYKRTLNPGTADFELTTHEHADKAWWVDAFAMDNVITLDEMPSLK